MPICRSASPSIPGLGHNFVIAEVTEGLGESLEVPDGDGLSDRWASWVRRRRTYSPRESPRLVARRDLGSRGEVVGQKGARYGGSEMRRARGRGHLDPGSGLHCFPRVFPGESYLAAKQLDSREQ